MLITSLAWCFLDLVILLNYSDCSNGIGWGCTNHNAENSGGHQRPGGAHYGGKRGALEFAHQVSQEFEPPKSKWEGELFYSFQHREKITEIFWCHSILREIDFCQLMSLSKLSKWQFLMFSNHQNWFHVNMHTTQFYVKSTSRCAKLSKLQLLAFSFHKNWFHEKMHSSQFYVKSISVYFRVLRSAEYQTQCVPNSQNYSFWRFHFTKNDFT